MAVAFRGDAAGKFVAVLVAFAVAESFGAGVVRVAQVGWDLHDLALLHGGERAADARDGRVALRRAG